MKTAVAKLKDMLDMQLKLNNETNGDDWRSGFTKDGKKIDWVLCAVMETTEMIDSVPWKHWKDLNAKPDMENVHVELVDIHHFLLSKALELEIKNGYDSLALFTIPFGNAIRTDRGFINRDLVVTAKRFIKSLLKLDDEISEDNFTETVSIFVTMLDMTNLCFQELYTKYMVKNILNGFRQENGYKDSTYHKMWLVNGEMVEDNVAVFSAVEDTGGEMTQSELTTLIEELYRDELERRKSEGTEEA